MSAQDENGGEWVEEAYSEVTMRYRVKRRLFSGQSEFQKVDVVETEKFGVMLLLDGYVMVTERDEFAYHDMIAHPAMFLHSSPKRVLIIGGGDGGTAREVLRHQSVEAAVMVEIDGMVVDVSKEFIPQTASELNNPKLSLLIEDGVKYVAETQDIFDVVIVDSTEPIGPATPLFGDAFYRNVSRILSDDGIVVAQGDSPFFAPDAQSSLGKTMGGVFPIVRAYNYANMTYPGGLWSFLYASKKIDPIRDFDETRVTQSGLEFRYYNADVHSGAFALPEFMKQTLSHSE